MCILVFTFTFATTGDHYTIAYNAVFCHSASRGTKANKKSLSEGGPGAVGRISHVNGH